MKKGIKKLLCLFLALTLCFGVFSGVLAASSEEGSYTVVNASPSEEGIAVNGGFLNAGAGGYIEGNIGGDEWYMGDEKNSISFTFTGTAIKVIAGKNADLGIADIYIDDKLVDSADLYNAEWIKQQTIYENTSLLAGSHTIRVECSGRKNDQSTGKVVIVDAFSYVGKNEPAEMEWITLDNTDPAISYTGNFNGEFAGTYNGGVTFYETASLSFKGTGVEIISSKNNDMGISEVYIDGVLQGEIDYYNGSFVHQQSLFKKEGLDNKEHTLEIKKTSKISESAIPGAGGLVSIDCIKYYGTKQVPDDPEEGKFVTVNAAAGIQGISTDGGFLNKGANGYIEGNIEGDEWYLSQGNSISFSFSGTRVKIIAGTNNDMGIANIYIDGQKIDEIDCYTPSWIKGKAIFDSGELTDGEHTIKMECSGNKNSQSANNIVVCDAFMYIPSYIPENERITVDDSSNKVSYKGKTERLDVEEAIEGTHTVFYNSASFTFDGSYLEIIGPKAPEYGKATVYIDGINRGEIDQYSAENKASELLFSSDPLSADSHTVKIVADEKSALDAFVYLSISEKNGIYTINSDLTKFIKYSEEPSHIKAEGALNSDVTVLKDAMSAEMDFYGNYIKIAALKKSGAGQIDIYIDDAKVDTVDTSSTKEELAIIYENSDLLNIPHTIKLVSKGQTAIDALMYKKADAVRISDDDPKMTFSDGFWTGEFAGDDGRTTFIASKGNATTKFTGVSASIYGPVNNNLGISEVYIDDVLVGSYSQYSDQWMHQQLLFAVDGLEPKEHTLKIVNTDTKEAASQMTYCIIDYVEYDEYEIESLLAINSINIIDANTVEIEAGDTSGRKIDYYDLKIKKGTNKSYLYDIDSAVLKKVSNTVFRFECPEGINIGDYVSVEGSRNFKGSSVVKYLPENACRILSAQLAGNSQIDFNTEYKEATKITKDDVVVEKSEGFKEKRALKDDEYDFVDNSKGNYTITLKTPLKNEDCIFISGKNMLYGQASVEFSSGAIVKVNNDDNRIKYTGNWSTDEDIACYRDDMAVTSDIGDSFEFIFAGTSISLHGAVGPDQGYADVFLDGVLIEEDLALFSETKEASKVFFEKKNLREGVHVITVKKAANIEGSEAPEESFLSLDAISYTSCDASCASYTLSGDFSIIKDETGQKGKDEKWYVCENYPFEKASPILVPGNVYEAFSDYNGITWYAKEFSGYLITSYGDRVYLEFEGVQYSCDVYLNGQYLGSHEGSAVPFEYDVTDVINLYGQNFLAVSVFNPEGMCKTGSASNYGAFWDAGGIWQDINLHVRPEVYIDNIYAKSNYKTGEVDLEVTVTNTSDEDREISLEADYGVRNGGKLGSVAQKSHVSKPGETVFTLKYKIDDFKLWELDSPNLYYVDVLLKQGDKEHSLREDHLGFRHFEIKDGYFYLNDERIYLKMTHQNVYDPVLLQGTPRDMYYVNKASKQLKDAGFNTIRMIGMEALPEQLDYCDEIGLLVYQESSQAWLGANNWFETVQDELIIRDRNHPSLVIWGLLNEIYASDSRVSQCRAYIGRLRELDDDRVVFLDSGRFDHDYSVAGISNSGSHTWDVCLGLEGSSSPAVGDIHTYPQYPMNTAILDYILYAGEGGNPLIFSEAGTGAMFNPFVEMRGLIKEGAANDANYPYSAWAKNLCDGLTEVYEKYGLSSLYDSAEGIPLDSIEVNRLQRLIMINYIRANQNGNGYGVTSLSDSQGLGEGLLDNFRDWKSGYDELMKNAWAQLRWDILLNNSNLNVEKGSEMKLRANITTEDVLAPGEYSASFYITDEKGKVVKQLEDETFTVKSGKDAPFAYFVLDQTAVIDFKEGVYTLNCKLNADYICENSTMDFTVTDNSNIVKKETRVTVLGDITSSMRRVLNSNGIVLEEYDADAHIDNEVILVGINVPDDAQLWRGLYKKVASGAYAAFLDSSALGTDNNWFPSENKGKREVVPLTMALYHADHLALPNETLFDGLDTGVMSPAYYGEQLLVPRNYFTGLDEPDEMNILMVYSQGLPISGETITGTAMGTYEYYSGAFTINILDLCNETTSPAVGRLLLNIINYGLEKSSKYTPIDDMDVFEKVLDSYDFKEDKVNMPVATIVDRENRKVKLVFDEYVRITQECIYLSESPNPERFQSQAGAKMEMVDAKTIDGQEYATTFILTFPEVNNLFTNSPNEEKGIPTGAGCRFLEYGSDPEGANGKTPNVVAPDGRQMKMNYVDGDSDIGFIRIIVEPQSLNIRTAGDLEKLAAGTITNMIAEFDPIDTTNTHVIWSVENLTGKAIIDSFGRLTALEAGTVEVTAVSDANADISAKRTFEIYGSMVKSISIEGETEVEAGTTAQYKAIVLPEDAINKNIIWSVENLNGEAKIDENGVLTAYKEGEVIVIATSAEQAAEVKAQLKVNIKKAKVSAEDFNVEGMILNPQVGDSGKYAVMVTPQDATDLPIFKSTDEEVLIVDEDGNWKALKKGHVKLMISVGDIVKTYDIKVDKKAASGDDNPGGENDKPNGGGIDEPKTGDNSYMTMYVGIIVTCICAMLAALAAIFKKKRMKGESKEA